MEIYDPDLADEQLLQARLAQAEQRDRAQPKPRPPLEPPTPVMFRPDTAPPRLGRAAPKPKPPVLGDWAQEAENWDRI
eukprot:2761452-Prorocentrum_lima.AAC.1